MIFQGDCRNHIAKGLIKENTVDLVLTSPPYNTGRGNKPTDKRLDEILGGKTFPYVRYDEYLDVMTNDEYNAFTVDIFCSLDKVLKPDGVILYNLSYGARNTTGWLEAVHSIIKETPFTLADVIAWHKDNAMPDNQSTNRLTRICEFVFVICRKGEERTFIANKQVSSVRATGQKMYHTLYNYVEAANNDGLCKLNKAAYSTELCTKLLNMYGKSGMTVYDPFMGTGTTGIAAKNLDMEFIGSELSEKQVEYAKNRLEQNTVQTVF